MTLLLALAWITFWGLLLGVSLYWRIRAKPVRATLIGVRGTDGDYRAIYRYTDAGGVSVDASVPVPGLVENLSTGSVDRLMVVADDPRTGAMRSSYLGDAVAALGILTGMLVLHANFPRWSGTRLAGLSLLAPCIVGLALFVKVRMTKAPAPAPEEPLQRPEDVRTTAGTPGPWRTSQRSAPGVVVLAFGLVAVGIALRMALPIVRLEIWGRDSGGVVTSVQIVPTGRGGEHVNYVVRSANGPNSVEFRDEESAPPSFRPG